MINATKNGSLDDKKAAVESFVPGYTWPNAAFPFRVYLNHDKCRIFIIENLTHNWNWFRTHRDGIRRTDFFFVISGWDFTGSLAITGARMLGVLNLPVDQFFILTNDENEQRAIEANNLLGAVVNNNCWLDENKEMTIQGAEKIFDAIYVARLVPQKRHNLARKVANLALVAGNPHQAQSVEPPPNTYINSAPLSRAEVSRKINQSKVGLCLSAIEGASYASSEYLLCGVPVVSTPSKGGRDAWYNEYNSIICEPTEDGVSAAVDQLIRKERDPFLIRQMHVDQSIQFRRKFISILEDVFARFEVSDIEAEAFFYANYFDKMKTSQHTDFNALFGSL